MHGRGDLCDYVLSDDHGVSASGNAHHVLWYVPWGHDETLAPPSNESYASLCRQTVCAIAGVVQAILITTSEKTRIDPKIITIPPSSQPKGRQSHAIILQLFHNNPSSL